VAGVTLFLEVLMGLVLKERLPHDRLSPHRETHHPASKRIQLAAMASIPVAILFGAIAFVMANLGWALLMASVPFLVPGIMSAREERQIRRREDDYAAFIRSVGAAAAARGGGVREVLAQVQANRLGALAGPVRDLYRRLAWRLDDERAWQRFGEESGSRLIDAFTSMFVEGLRSGGKPGRISRILSDNMLRIQALRASRRATAGTFRGLLLGLSAGLGLVLFMGTGVFANLQDLFAGQADVIASTGILDIHANGNQQMTYNVLLTLLALHGIAAALYYKLVEGGRADGAMLYVTLHVWMGVGTGILVHHKLPGLV
jgi:archaeal flagellar protein FlaJ